MLKAIILTLLLGSYARATTPVIYDSGSTVVIQEQSVVLTKSDFRYATAGLVGRSALLPVVATQDSLIAALKKSNSTCSTEVVTKNDIIKATDSRVDLAHQETAIVRDSAKVATHASFWRGFGWGTVTTIGAEAVAAVLLLWATHGL